MFYSFELDAAHYPGLSCIICRDRLDGSNEFDNGFLVGSCNFRSHDDGIVDAVKRVLTDDTVTSILISRNCKLVLDESLRDRLATAFDMLGKVSHNWVLASPGGLGLNGERYCSLYSTETPFVWYNPSVCAIVDTMLDLYIVNAGTAREFLDTCPSDLNSFFETGLIIHGYLNGKVSLFVPHLAAAVYGPFVSRDIIHLQAEADRCLARQLPGQQIKTLSGPLTVKADFLTENDNFKRVGCNRLVSKNFNLGQLIDDAVERHLASLSISIVTRTRFQRPHLLRRLLSSVTRARIPDADVEVVLSSDANESLVQAEVQKLRIDFPNISIALSINVPKGHSRVCNLVEGIARATKDYIWIIDDDDYIDVFAFQHLRKMLFGISRPLIFASSEVHNETWNLEALAPTLTSSVVGSTWQAKRWKQLFSGVNQLPICSAIVPREFLASCLSRFELRYDLSEDYALFLLMLTAPDTPPIAELQHVVAHISVRQDGDNTITAEDRTGWARDIVGHLYNLRYDDQEIGRGAWSIVAALSATAATSQDDDEAVLVQKLIAERDRKIALLSKTIENLQRLATRGGQSHG